MNKEENEKRDNVGSCMYSRYHLHICPTCGSHQELIRMIDGSYQWRCSNRECFSHVEHNCTYTASSGV